MEDIQNIRVGIVGGTGLVGQQMLEIMEARELFPRSLRIVASQESLGKVCTFGGQEIDVEVLSDSFFQGVDVILASAGSKVSQTYFHGDNLRDTLVIDNCSYFRMDPDVPLIIPEINNFELNTQPKKSIIANPNCTTIGMLMALAPLHEAFAIQKVVCTSYQSVSGAGQKGIECLSKEIQTTFESREIKPDVFTHPIAFNLLPVIGQLQKDGHAQEEVKMVCETHKILDESIQVHATCVRVPTFFGHGTSLYIECEDEIDVKEARAVLSEAQGVRLLDAPDHKVYPLLSDVQGEDDVLVGRLRQGTQKHSLQLWVVSDNIRKGAALNAIQIMEDVLAQDWF